MNTNIKDVLIALGVFLIALLLFPSNITNIILLVMFSAVLLCCIVRFGRRAGTATWVLLGSGIVISVFAALRFFFSIATDIPWFQYTWVLLFALASTILIVWMLVLVVRSVYFSLRKDNRAPAEPVS